MSGKTGIEWCTHTWNPVVGCRKVSEGCRFCYAKTLHDMRHAAQLAGKNVAPQYAKPFETVQLMPDRLGWPLSLRTPSRIFVNSVSDLFHEDVPGDFIERVFATMALAQRHTFQILTKRPERMREWFATRCGLESIEESVSRIASHVGKIVWDSRGSDYFKYSLSSPADVANRRPWPGWPLPNVWLGTSVENQPTADERIPFLLQTPAAVRFLSGEPLLGPIDLEGGDAYPSKGWLRGWHAEQEHSRDCNSVEGCVCQGEAVQVQNERIDWVITGGESGSSKQNPRPMHPDWARSLRDQCVAAGVPFFFKQHGDWVNYQQVGANGWQFTHQDDGKRYGHLTFAGAPRIRSRSYETQYPWIAEQTGNPCMVRVGTKKAGRVLDGRTWDEFPTVRP